MSDWLGDLMNQADTLMDTLRWTYGPCTADENMKELNAALKTAKTQLKWAENLQYFMKGKNASTHFRNVQGAIDAVSSALNKTEKTCSNFKSVYKIRLAVRELNAIGHVSNDPARAAVAFGKLTSGIGELASYLPFPANSYVGLLKESEGFFSALQSNMDLNSNFRRRAEKYAPDAL